VAARIIRAMRSEAGQRNGTQRGRMRKERMFFYIELDGERLTPEQIQAIAHSEAYKDRLLAFNERLA
jgi:hypothetical protein